MKKITEGFIDRVFLSGFATTLIGVVFMAAALYDYLIRGASPTEVTAITAIGFIFLRAKSSLIGLK